MFRAYLAGYSATIKHPCVTLLYGSGTIQQTRACSGAGPITHRRCLHNKAELNILFQPSHNCSVEYSSCHAQEAPCEYRASPPVSLHVLYFPAPCFGKSVTTDEQEAECCHRRNIFQPVSCHSPSFRSTSTAIAFFIRSEVILL